MDITTFRHGSHDFDRIDICNTIAVEDIQHGNGAFIKVLIHAPQFCISGPNHHGVRATRKNLCEFCDAKSMFRKQRVSPCTRVPAPVVELILTPKLLRLIVCEPQIIKHAEDDYFP